MHASSSNPAAYLEAKPLGGASLVAAGAGDNTAITSGDIDLSVASASCIIVSGRATVANGETLKLTVTIEESADGGATHLTPETLANAVTVVTGPVTNSDFTYKLQVKHYPRNATARFNITPDLSASGTDAAKLGAALVYTPKQLPAS